MFMPGVDSQGPNISGDKAYALNYFSKGWRSSERLLATAYSLTFTIVLLCCVTDDTTLMMTGAH